MQKILQGRKKIRIALLGAGYMGGAYARAISALPATFANTVIPIGHVIATSSAKTAKAAALKYNFAYATDNWQAAISDKNVDAVIIATPQEQHLQMVLAACKHNKPFICEKPAGNNATQCKQMLAAAEKNQVPHLIGFNYRCTPAQQLIKKMLSKKELGDIYALRAEHSEDFLADPKAPLNRRCFGFANGTLGDLSPHLLYYAQWLLGPIKELCSDYRIVHHRRADPNKPGKHQNVTNDDMAHILCRFTNDVTGNLTFSRVAGGRKMGLCFEIYGSKGSIRFDQEDQNTLWHHKIDGKQESGFKKIVIGTSHPDFAELCPGDGHGTGYQEQITIELRDFLQTIKSKKPHGPTLKEALQVHMVINTIVKAKSSGKWQKVPMLK